MKGTRISSTTVCVWPDVTCVFYIVIDCSKRDARQLISPLGLAEQICFYGHDGRKDIQALQDWVVEAKWQNVSIGVPEAGVLSGCVAEARLSVFAGGNSGWNHHF